MLAGLIFATDDADDRPDALAATLPFGGMTLIEYQARLLASVGVSHLMIAVQRVTPALLGAVSRISERGVAVDIVRSAGEAAAKAHPLAQVIVVADGLVTTDAVIEWVAAAPHEALLVSRDGDGTGGERVDAGHLWAGLARVPSQRIAEVAAMPDDYDFQSTMLRQAAAAGAQQLVLPAATARTRHGVERSAAALMRRSKSVLAALSDRRTAWVDRAIFTPLTSFALPQLVQRGVPGWALVLGATLAATGSAALFAFGRSGGGVALALLSVAQLSTGSMLAWLRGEDRAARLQERGAAAVSAATVILTGALATRLAGDGAAIVLAIVTVGLAVLVERTTSTRQRWWATPAAYPVLLLIPIVAGWPTTGLAALALYAFATLAAAIEGGRAQA